MSHFVSVVAESLLFLSRIALLNLFGTLLVIIIMCAHLQMRPN